MRRSGGSLRLEVKIEPHRGLRGKCASCMKPSPGYDRVEERRWLFIPMWGIIVHFFYAPRRVECADHGVGVEHIFSALLDVRTFVDTVRRAEGDAARLRTTVDGVLDTERPKSDLRRAPPNEPAVQRMISARDVTALPSGTTVATIRMLCLQLARQDEAERFWTAAGIHGSDFVRAVHLP